MTNEHFIQTFVQEARDYLEEVEPAIIELKHQSDLTGEVDHEAIDSIFRLFHSMKGSSGFLQLDNITRVTHQAETFLDQFRKQTIPLTAAHAELIFKTLDFLHQILDFVEEHQDDRGFERAVDAIVRELSQNALTMEVKPEPSPPVMPQLADEPEDSGFTSAFELFSEESILELPEIEITEEIRQRFAQEGEELLEAAEEALLRASDSQDPFEQVNEGFRHIHSFKGNCGFMGFAALERFSHEIEAVLEQMVEGTIPYRRENLQILLELIDVLRSGLSSLSRGGKESIDRTALARLRDISTSDTPSPQHVAEKSSQTAAPSPLGAILVIGRPPFQHAAGTALSELGLEVHTAADSLEGDRQIQQLSGIRALRALVVELASDSDPLFAWLTTIQSSQASPPVIVYFPQAKSKLESMLRAIQVAQALPLPVDPDQLLRFVEQAIEQASTLPSERRDIAKKTVHRKDIRVDLEKLDSLVDLVGELVIAEAMVTRNPDLEGLELENFERASHHLRRLTASLQDIAMSVRMIPLSATFRRMLRLVHDISTKYHKKIKLELVGEETEVDKNIIELIADPLIHIIRNACDHGVEAPDERLAAGKPDTGHIILEARHVGGEVWIIVQDDGRGLNRAKIQEKAIKRGLLPADSSGLADDQVFKMIFEPGFSTADKVTDISGRGVGMDVVKKNLAKLKGRIDVRSKFGQGTSMILRIPLTLAIIEGMLVRVGRNNYTIPLLSIRESLRPQRNQVFYTPDGQEILKLRDEIIPVLRLHELYQRKADIENLWEGILVVIEDNRRQLAIFVDEIIGQQKTVIKGLSGFFGDARGISGCTILGNGQVSLILDVGSLVDAYANTELIEGIRNTEDADVLPPQ